MAKKESIFSTAAAERQKEQQDLENQMTSENKRNDKPKVLDKRVTLNITLPQKHKDKLKEIARQRNLSASIIVQTWIEEHWEG